MTPMQRSLGAAVVLAIVLSCPASRASATPPLERYVLTTGTVLLVSPQRTLPLVDIEVVFDAGSRRDPRGREGLASLTASLLSEGTAMYSAPALAEAIDGLGAELSAGAGIDSASVRLRVLREDLDTGLALLGEILLRPSFPPSELERRRAEVLAGMRAAEDRPGHVAYRQFLTDVFGEDPYGHLIEGTAASVAALRRDDVISFYRAHYGPDRAIVTVVGDVDAEETRERIQALSAKWAARGGAAFVHPEPQRRQPGVTVISRPLSQTSVILGHRGIARTDPDLYAVEVMNHILGGGGFGSRLLDSVRTEGGLAYSVGSAFSTPMAPGSFRVSMQTKTESTLDAIRRTCRELLRIRDEPVTADELEAAKLYLTGNFPLQLDSNRKIAGFLAEQERFALGANYPATYRDRILAVTAEDVRRVAQTHIRPGDLHLVLVGDVTWEDGDRLNCSSLLGANNAGDGGASQAQHASTSQTR